MNRILKTMLGFLTAKQEVPTADDSIDAELAANQRTYPFPKWALDGTRARVWILANIPRGGIGAEVGVFRGHFSEVILETLAPTKFYLVDPWTSMGEFFPWRDDYTNQGKLPTAVARREAQLRSAKFPGTNTVIIESTFPACLNEIGDRLDWIYIDSSHRYKETLAELKAAAGILKPNGVIIGDDYYPNRSSKHHGVFRAVNEFVKTAPFEFVAAGPRAQWCLRRTDIASIATKGQPSIAKRLLDNQKKFPYPKRGFEEIRVRQDILEFASPGSVGAEVGAFRGHFSEIMLAKRTPRKFFLIDNWTGAGERFPRADEFTNNGELPTALARNEAEWRTALFPNTETILVDDDFTRWAAQAATELVDWIYLHNALTFRHTLQHLVMSARILKPGGVIMGDGYFPDSAGFQHGIFHAISSFIGAAQYEFIALGRAGQWCLRRPMAG